MSKDDPHGFVFKVDPGSARIDWQIAILRQLADQLEAGAPTACECVLEMRGEYPELPELPNICEFADACRVIETRPSLEIQINVTPCEVHGESP